MVGNQSNFIQIDKTIAESIADIITKQYVHLNEKQYDNASEYMHYVELKLDKTSISFELFDSISRLLIEKRPFLKDPKDQSAIKSFLLYRPKEKIETNDEKKSPVVKNSYTKSSTDKKSPAVKKPWKECRDGDRCPNDWCSFTHPNGKEKKNSIACKFGDNCNNNKCKFSHE